MNPNSSPAAETIASLCRQLDKAQADLAAAQKACAEMRPLVELLECKCDTASFGGYTCPRCHALSLDCGRGFIPVKELEPTIELMDEIYRNDPGDMPVLREKDRLEALKGGAK